MNQLRTQIINGVYHIDQPIGEGGMAIVYQATHLKTNEKVAIKVLKATTDGALRMRFLQELIAITTIEHPNVLKVLDFGIIEETNELFLVMELLKGDTLRERLNTQKFIAPKEALRMSVDVLRALALYHEKGIIHKDIKPSNFIVEPLERNELILMDFGIAHQMGSTRLTSESNITTTVQYSAPEYLRHQTITPQLDIYQMGLVLVEMLTGQQAVASEDPIECLKKHCLGLLDIPKALKNSSVWLVLCQALTIEPTQRFETAAQFADALEVLDWDAVEQSIKQLQHKKTANDSASLFLKNFTSNERTARQLMETPTITEAPTTLIDPEQLKQNLTEDMSQDMLPTCHQTSRPENKSAQIANQIETQPTHANTPSTHKRSIIIGLLLLFAAIIIVAGIVSQTS